MKEITKRLSEELNLPQEVVGKAYRAYWKFIRQKIEELPLKSDLTEEEFSKLRTNFNLPYLGKLSCTYERWKKVKENKRLKVKQLYVFKHKENKTDVQPGHHNDEQVQ